MGFLRIDRRASSLPKNIALRIHWAVRCAIWYNGFDSVRSIQFIFWADGLLQDLAEIGVRERFEPSYNEQLRRISRWFLCAAGYVTEDLRPVSGISLTEKPVNYYLFWMRYNGGLDLVRNLEVRRLFKIPTYLIRDDMERVKYRGVMPYHQLPPRHPIRQLNVLAALKAIKI